MIVIDASVLVKALIVEANSDVALTFLDERRSQLVAPDLLWTEVTSAIVRDVNDRAITAQDGAELLEYVAVHWREGWITSYRLTPDSLAEAAQVAMILGHPLADCVYLQIAEMLDLELATFDAKFHAKARSRGDRVRLLGTMRH